MSWQWLPLFFLTLSVGQRVRVMPYNGARVATTFRVPDKFYGRYEGRKSGYLILNKDGSGTYSYDVFGFAPADCKQQPIAMVWGFLIDDDSTVVAFERDYGFSYPLLLQSTGETSFQGCRKTAMLDFILEYRNGDLGVSSSDDWVQKSSGVLQSD